MDQIEDDDLSHEGGPRLTKRRRIGMACIPCRARKVRCDGSRPKCSVCSRNSTPCEYQPASQMINISREYIQRLKSKAEASERRRETWNASQGGRISPQYGQGAGGPNFSQVSTHEDSTVSFDHGANEQCHASRSQDTEPFKRLAEAEAINKPEVQAQLDGPEIPSPPPLIPVSANREDSNAASNPQQDSTGVRLQRFPEWSRAPALSATTHESNPDEFYGDSSTLSFMHAVQTTASSNSSPVSPDWGHGGKDKPGAPETVLSQFGAESCLPQRALADELVTSYFCHVHLLYPFLHRPTFEAQYRRTWVSEEPQDDQWLAILNVVFALGVQFTSGLADQSAARERFFGYAKKLVSMEKLTCANLPTLQLLLLTGLYYHYTSNPNHTWNVVGLAIRIATTIGVHVDQLPSQYNPLHSELRRRCWYGCVVLDSYLALTLGRPTGIPSTFKVPLPSDLDDDYITEGGYIQQPVYVKSKTAFFIESVSFCSIMKEVINTLYSPPNGPNAGEGAKGCPSAGVEDALALDKKLVEWYHGLPEYLKTSAVDDVEEFEWLRNILLARFLNLRVLIHRPFASLRPLPSALSQPTHLASLESRLRSISVSICRSAAIELVAVVCKNYNQGLRGSWWAEMNYLFTAATVLMALEYQCRDPEGGDAPENAFQQSLKILREMQAHSSIASTYVIMLGKAKKCEEAEQNPRYDQGNSRSPSNKVMVERNGPIWESPAIERRPDEYATFFPWDASEIYLEPWNMMTVDCSISSFQL
ncbi:fungal-specific transcription factor domain-containing protein [Rhexocercosporidium sp. MPI-PUGE-AT-0058]|nr:fungal-specific transcription factor domain-containing protein [Rhexocercosporidium sp. MPI-PUGE-AT-0058]